MLKIYSNFIGAESFENVIPNDLKNKPITIFNDYANITQEQLEFNPYNILMVISRINKKCHTPLQTFAGATLGLLGTYLLNKVFFP